ncbi:hypothetical protein ERICV_05126 [Paenibacillus phage phiERICV]|uniref:Uncharacterized protein n=1 Tax=Paenibacillus larvae subsp. larvae TaxID=147375 RepID=A0A6C0QMQ8_9BACL|nr:hypothetical protein [Paenibacillus larvae]QHZ50025.1 hypothetical protein ERICV_00848 [Paenibacillus larvae subsp. larvae]QHZ54110.1 hypothetical protein ERICV_05126 [Paenibacillus phage phiERICV]
MAIKVIWTIVHDDQEYSPGETISGLSEEEEHRLVKLGAAEQINEAVPPLQQEPDQAQGEKEENNLFGVVEDKEETLPTVEEFTVLQANEQKELLESLEIKPGTNAETRIEQYKELYEQEDENV